LDSRYFGPAKVVREGKWGGRGSGRTADFVAIDCERQEAAAHGHVLDGVQEVSKTAANVPEMSVVR
jgi:hypothetical protein